VVQLVLLEVFLDVLLLVLQEVFHEVVVFIEVPTLASQVVLVLLLVAQLVVVL
jgi:hypothetical protein